MYFICVSTCICLFIYTHINTQYGIYPYFIDLRVKEQKYEIIEIKY